MDVNMLIKNAWSWIITSGIQIIIIILLAFIALKIAVFLSNKLVTTLSHRKKDSEYQKRAETLGAVIRNTLRIIIFVTTSMMIMNELGIEIGPILAAAGIVGLAVGFGAQNLVQDVISGFFILMEDQIRVGDVIQTAGKGGLVEKVNLRMTVLRDLTGNVHFIRNGKIDIVTNMTKDYSRYVFEIGVAYRENVDEVIEVIKKVDEEMRNDPEYKDDILEPIEVLGLDQFGDSALIIKARNKTKPIQQWRIARGFNGRLKKKFDELNIEIPFPHRTIYMGQDKLGQASPLHVRTENGET